GEVRTYWNDPANKMATIAGPRTVVHFVSGKSVQGGIAYLDVLCDSSYGYGVSQVYGSFDLSQPSQIWDALVFTHELGHNFGTPHTHCYSPPLDKCFSGEAGCYSGPVVTSRGTIMSYCHLLAGGLSNIDLVFGSTVSDRINQSVAQATCLTDVPIVSTTTTTGITTTSTTSTTQTTTSSTSTSTTRPSSTTTSSTSTTTAAATTSTTSAGSSSTTTTLPVIRRSGDSDHDGVPDATDACDGTPSGDLVDATGCSVCPCAAPRDTQRDGLIWSTRRDYLGCVRTEAKRRVAAGTLTRTQKQDAMRSARHASRGRLD